MSRVAAEHRSDDEPGRGRGPGNGHGAGQHDDDSPRNQPPSDEEHQRDDGHSRDQDHAPPKKPLYKRPVFWIIIGVLLVAAIVALILWLTVWRFHITTDDAFIAAHSTTVSPRISGHVIKVHVDDNQDVQKGDTLVELDPSDQQQALNAAQASFESANAQLAQAQAQVASAQASVAQAQADVTSAEASAKQAEADKDRYHNVLQIDPRAVSKQQVDQADANARTTAAQLLAAKEKAGAAQAQVKVAQAQIVAAQAMINKARSDVENAKLQLSYTTIRAAEAGQVTGRSVEVGNYITPGQALMSLVPHDVYVIANYKETQLRKMQLGDAVKIHVDAYDIDIEGHVQSIQAGSGAAFSLLPPENATGNYVKVVQRLPVKITIDQLPPQRLSPGMSVEPTVEVKH